MKHFLLLSITTSAVLGLSLSSCGRTPKPISDIPKVEVQSKTSEFVSDKSQTPPEPRWYEQVIFPVAGETLNLENRKGNAINNNGERILISSQVTEPKCGWGVSTPAILINASELDIKSGETLRLKVQAKKTRDVPHEIGLCYTTNGAGGTGWKTFELSSGLMDYTLDFIYPANRISLDSPVDYIAIWADTAGVGKTVEIRSITIMQSEL